MYWLYDTIKFLVFIAIIILAFRKLMEAIRNKALTWETVQSFFSGLRRTIHNLNEETKQQAMEDQQTAQAAARDSAAHVILTGQETILILGKNYDLVIFYVIFYILTAIVLLFFGIAWEEIGMTVALLFIAAFIIWLCYAVQNYLQSLRTLVVTNKRIYYRFLSHQVDLPLDFISAVGTHFFLMFTVSTPSGVIRIPWLENYRQLHETAVSLLLARQTDAPKESREPEPAVQVQQKETAAPEPREPDAPAQPESVGEAPASEPVPEVPAPEASPAAPAIQAVTDKQRSSDEIDWFAPPVRQESRLADQGMRIGRCVMCRRIELPVKTVPVILAGVERKRTLCEKCAEKHGVKDPAGQAPSL